MLAGHIRDKYGVELSVVLERPPKLEMGEAASPVCFELAKRLKKAPRQIAQEIANSLPKIEGIGRVEVAGAGYLNAFFDRAWFWESARKEASGPSAALRASERKKVIVEHTSINPNKAAHIGHLRNVVLAFQQMEKKSLADVKVLATGKNFDYLCWDLYAKATQFFEEDKVRAGKLRGETLKAIEAGEGETAEMATVIADAVVGFHLRTMARLDIYYELLARESEILHLHFWDAAFEKLKASGAIQLATSGKNAGCWIMPWGKKVKEGEEVKESTGSSESLASSTSSEEEDQSKIIVRSNGTVTYVGKDIAYQLWKFGLLGKDFHYRRWPNAPEGETVWATTSGANDLGAPHFGEPASSVYNVIDARQAYLQKVVAAGLRALGHGKEAERSIHLSYEIVALTPRRSEEHTSE